MTAGVSVQTGSELWTLVPLALNGLTFGWFLLWSRPGQVCAGPSAVGSSSEWPLLSQTSRFWSPGSCWRARWPGSPGSCREITNGVKKDEVRINMVISAPGEKKVQYWAFWAWASAWSWKVWPRVAWRTSPCDGVLDRNMGSRSASAQLEMAGRTETQTHTQPRLKPNPHP